MGGNVTVSVRSILLAGLVGLALVTAYLLGGQGDAVTAPASAATEDQSARSDKRLIRMVGTGEATAVPDQISFSVSATAKRMDLDDALAASNATMRRVLAGLADHGVEKADVQTTGLSMHPEYHYPLNGRPVLTGYRVTQRAQVQVDELARGGPAIGTAVDAGGNGVRVSGIRLGIADPDAVLERARDAAVEAATTKAEQYAAATGQALGQVVSVQELSGSTRRYQPTSLLENSYRSADLAKALPIRAGEDDLKVRIQVVWALQ